MQLEDSFFKIAASTGRPSICFLDRGLLDIPAYLPPKQWQDVLDATGFKEADMAERYLILEVSLRIYEEQQVEMIVHSCLSFLTILLLSSSLSLVRSFRGFVGHVYPS